MWGARAHMMHKKSNWKRNQEQKGKLAHLEAEKKYDIKIALQHEQDFQLTQFKQCRLLLISQLWETVYGTQNQLRNPKGKRFQGIINDVCAYCQSIFHFSIMRRPPACPLLLYQLFKLHNHCPNKYENQNFAGQIITHPNHFSKCI